MKQFFRFLFYSEYDFWKENTINAIREIENSSNKEEIINTLYFKQ